MIHLMIPLSDIDTPNFLTTNSTSLGSRVMRSAATGRGRKVLSHFRWEILTTSAGMIRTGGI